MFDFLKYLFWFFVVLFFLFGIVYLILLPDIRRHNERKREEHIVDLLEKIADKDSEK